MPWPLRFAEPGYLLLLLTLPAFWWISRKSLAGLPPMRRTLALLLRIGIALLLILALARVQWRSTSDRVAVYFVLDWSDSIPTRPPDLREEILGYVQAVAKSARRERAEPDLTGLIYFGDDATVEHPPSPMPPPHERQAVVEADGTDIAAALRLALSTFPGGVRRRIVLVSDGNQNRGDVLAEVEAARTKGTMVDVLPVLYHHDREIIAEKMVVPERVQEGIPFNITTVVSSSAAAEATLALRRNGILIDSYDITLDARRQAITLPTVVEGAAGEILSGLVTWEAEVQPRNPADDRIAENNTASAFSNVQGPPNVLYIDGNMGEEGNYVPQLQEALLRELRLYAQRDGEDAPEVRLHLVGADGIPGEEQLPGYDAIILDNVSAFRLGARRMARIRTLVNDQGVGLLMIGGDKSFGAGGYLRTPVEEALPVDMDIRNRKVLPNGALAIVLHTCEFDNGNWWAKQITKKAIDTLGEGDYVGVLLYSGGDGWLFPMTQAVNRTRLKALVDTASPGDMPTFDPTMRMAQEGLATTPAVLKHMIIISDGDPSPPTPAVMKRLSASGITVSTVAIGTHATPLTMQAIAKQTGGRFHNVTNPNQLPEIFTREAMVVRRGLLSQETFTPALNPRASHEMIQDILPGGFPPLHGHVICTPKAAAEVSLLVPNEERDPLLAHWHYGLGQAAAFTSDAKNAWGTDWVGWDRYGTFWGGVVWRILREPPENLRMTTEVEGGTGRITVQALDDDGNPVPFLDLVAGVSTPGAESRSVILRQTGLGTYEADFPVDAVGRYQITVTTRGEDESGFRATARGGVSVPQSAELERLEPNGPLLARIAEKGGGRLLEGDPEVDRPYRREGLPPAMDFRNIWALLILAGTLLFPLDVFTRRVMLDGRAIRRWAARWTSAALGREPPPDNRVDRLREAKRAAVRQRPRAGFLDGLARDGAEGLDLTSGAPPPERKATPARDVHGAAPSAKRPARETDTQAESYTARLLKAKKRAMEDRRHDRPD